MTIPLLLIAALMQQPPTQPSMSADELAGAVMKANGADAWRNVTRLRFTFNAQRPDGKTVVRAHDWDVKNMTDAVTVDGKTTAVKLVGARDENDKDAKAAFAAWTNDTYWLMSPLKIMDGGVTRTTRADETVEGKTYHVLHLSFGSVGLTPADQYDLYVDPETNLVRLWTYMPGKGGEPRHFTRDEYQDFKGVKLATKFMENGKPVISFTGIEAVTP